MGVFPRATPLEPIFEGLPHLRGGVSPINLSASLSGLSSPPTWGCFQVSLASGNTGEVFPTYVGVFLKMEALKAALIGLPHLRGGVSAKEIEDAIKK